MTYITCIVAVVTILVGTSIKAMSFGSNRAEVERIEELMSQGYSAEVAIDQMQEELYNRNGQYGTGGIDGKLLPSGGSSSGETTSCSHNYVVEQTKEPTCTEIGKNTYTCSKCGKVYTESIQKIDHDYDCINSTQGTCIEPASYEFKCKDCGATYTESGNLGEHLYKKSEESLEPTCIEGGEIIYICLYCEDTYTETVDAIGHNYGELVADKESTCTDKGEQSRYCITCKDRIDVKETEAMGHQKAEELKTIKEPSLFTKGKASYNCIRCNKVLETIEINNKGGVVPFIVTGVMGVILLGMVGFAVVKITCKKK